MASNTAEVVSGPDAWLPIIEVPLFVRDELSAVFGPCDVWTCEERTHGACSDRHVKQVEG